MNKIAKAAAAAFGVMFAADLVIHTQLLRGMYQQTLTVWRPHGDAPMWLMTVGQLLFAIVFTYIYTKGYEAAKPGAGQGMRYGLLIGKLLAILDICVWYVVLPIPFALAASWAAASIVKCALAGAAVGALYRK